MIPLKYQRNEYVEDKYYDLIIQNRNPDYIKEIEDKCTLYLQMSFKEIVCASPEKMQELHNNIIARQDYEQIKKEFKYIYSPNKENNYIVTTLYERMPQEAKQLLYKQVGLKVCPYCNRNFIDKLKINKNVRTYAGTFELDHFYPKEKFPMFAVSFYNLIPVCGTCNGIKSNEIFKLNPYLLDVQKDDISFKYNIVGIDYMNNEDDIEIEMYSSSKVALEDAENLRLEELYNSHKDIVQEIIKKMKYYNPEYIKCLMNETGVLFKDKNEVYRLLYGGYANPNEFGKRPLSKFIKDIYYDTKEMLNGLDIFSEDENTN